MTSDIHTMMEEALHFAKIAYEMKAEEVERLKAELARKDAEISELSHRLAASPVPLSGFAGGQRGGPSLTLAGTTLHNGRFGDAR